MQDQFISYIDNEKKLFEWINSLRAKYPTYFTPTSYIYEIDFNDNFKIKLKNWLSIPRCEKDVVGMALLIRLFLINKDDSTSDSTNVYIPPAPQLWRQNALPLRELPF